MRAALLEMGHLYSNRLRRPQGLVPVQPHTPCGLFSLPSFYDCKLRMVTLGNSEDHMREWK